MNPGESWKADVRASLRAGMRVFVAAGGDGTVHSLTGAIVDARGDVRSAKSASAPWAWARATTFTSRSGTCAPEFLSGSTWMGPAARSRTHPMDRRARSRSEAVLVVSASAGIVAEGNALFTSCPLGRLLPSIAIAVAALRAIARNRSSRFFLRHDQSREEIELSSLSVLKTQWLSGSLRYDVRSRQTTDTSASPSARRWAGAGCWERSLGCTRTLHRPSRDARLPNSGARARGRRPVPSRGRRRGRLCAARGVRCLPERLLACA